MRRTLSSIITQTHLPRWLLLLLTLVFILRIPSFFEPYWYGDEAIYLTLGEQMKQGLLLYKDIYDNKPPLIYLVTAVAGNLFWFKAILVFWSIATIILFWRLGRILWRDNERTVRLSTITVALFTTLPILEGNIANAELFMILPVIASFVILLSGKLTARRIVTAGIIAGLGVLFKVPSALDIFVPTVLWWGAVLTKRLRGQDFAKRSLLYITGALAPVAVSLVVFATQGALQEYISAAFVQTVGYLSGWRGAQGEFFVRNQPLILRGVAVLLIILYLLSLYQKRKISQPFLFASSWFVLSLFAVLLSERPYPHYLIQIVPSLGFLVGIVASQNSREQFYPYPLFLLLGAALIFYKFTYYPVFSYYANFLSWTAGQQDQTQFFSNFDKRTPGNYDIARFLTQSTKKNDHLFIWGDEPEIYALSRVTPASRYVTAYHIKDLKAFDETAKALLGNPPRFIITTQSMESFPKLWEITTQDYTLLRTFQNAQLWLHTANNGR